MPWARMSWRASPRNAGHFDPNASEPTMQAAPPSATVKGAPRRWAMTPAYKALHGAMPMNIME